MQLELHEEVGEWNNKRIWRFKWLVIKVQKSKHADGTFTIRGKTAGHTIEKIYPLSFPKFKKVMLLDEYKIRRAKLYYIRDKVGKDARMKSILSKEEKNIDLLTLAMEEAEAIKAAYDEATQPTQVEEQVEELQTDETVETPTQEATAETTSDDVQSPGAETDETPVETESTNESEQEGKEETQQ